MDSTPASKSPSPRDESGIALFMVIAAMTILSVLVTEFVYVAQVNQRMAYDGLDQLKAHYLAKTGFKLSLLRLKAYYNVKGALSSLGGSAGGAGLPKGILDKIWSFPFFYPVPSAIPGLTPAEKDRIEEFTKNSGLDGKFSAVIESESSKYNLNLILAPFVPPAPKPSASPAAPPADGATPAPSPSPTPSFNPDDARQSLKDYLQALWDNRVKADPDFGEDHRDFVIDDFMDNLVAWADRTYEKKNGGGREYFPPKKAPFYTLAELRMIAPMEDEIFEIFAPALTVSFTPGINVNTMQEAVLRALVPQIEDEEVKEFFKFRDSTEDDNLFKDPQGEDFFKWVGSSVRAYAGDKVMDEYKASLKKRNIRIVVDETNFKITVQAQAGQSTRLLEAWVTATPPKSGATAATRPVPGTSSPASPAAAPPLSGPGGQTIQDSGINVTFMRIL